MKKKQTVLYTWLGTADCNAILKKIGAITDDKDYGKGPVITGLDKLKPNMIEILYQAEIAEFNSDQITEVIDFLKDKYNNLKSRVNLNLVNLKSPTDYSAIYEKVNEILVKNIKQDQTRQRYFHLTPGTPAMSSIWLLLSHSKYEAKLIQTNRHEPIYQEVDLPFDLSIELEDKINKYKGEKTTEFVVADSLKYKHFKDIIFESDVMKKAVYRAEKAAKSYVPVLLQGESGTGKEMFAHSIHKASSRQAKAFIAVNCGAIPKDILESELFGHLRGAFTGAETNKQGLIRAANGGTLFLDEIGEMPLDTQVKLLRVLQEKKVRPVGSEEAIEVDVRIIAATHVNLNEAIKEGKFREDLYYRIAVGIIELPPLRSRGNDINLLIKHYLDEMHQNMRHDSNQPYQLELAARKFLKSLPLYGNVRELSNILKRAGLWSETAKICEAQIKEATINSNTESRWPDFNISEGIDVCLKADEFVSVQIEKAKELTKTKADAAKLLGFKNYQTMDNRQKEFLRKNEK